MACLYLYLEISTIVWKKVMKGNFRISTVRGIHKSCGHGRGRGLAKRPYYCISPIYYNDSLHEGEGVTNIQKTDHTVYGWPLKYNIFALLYNKTIRRCTTNVKGFVTSRLHERHQPANEEPDTLLRPSPSSVIFFPLVENWPMLSDGDAYFWVGNHKYVCRWFVKWIQQIER